MIVINKKLKMIVIIKINKICYNQFRSNAPALKFEVWDDMMWYDKPVYQMIWYDMI